MLIFLLLKKNNDVIPVDPKLVESILYELAIISIPTITLEDDIPAVKGKALKNKVETLQKKAAEIILLLVKLLPDAPSFTPEEFKEVDYFSAETVGEGDNLYATTQEYEDVMKKKKKNQ